MSKAYSVDFWKSWKRNAIDVNPSINNDNDEKNEIILSVNEPIMIEADIESENTQLEESNTQIEEEKERNFRNNLYDKDDVVIDDNEDEDNLYVKKKKVKSKNMSVRYKPKEISDREWKYLITSNSILLPSKNKMTFIGTSKRGEKNKESYGDMWNTSAAPSSFTPMCHPTLHSDPKVFVPQLGRDNIKASGAVLPSTSNLPLGPGAHDNNKSSLGTQIQTQKKTAPNYSFSLDKKSTGTLITAGCHVGHLLPPQKPMIGKSIPEISFGHKCKPIINSNQNGAGYVALPTYLGQAPSFKFTSAKNAEEHSEKNYPGRYKKPTSLYGFGFGCNVDEHLEYGQCIDGRCSNRKNFEIISHKTRNRKPRGSRDEGKTSKKIFELSSQDLEEIKLKQIEKLNKKREIMEEQQEAELFKKDPISFVKKEVDNPSQTYIQEKVGVCFIPKNDTKHTTQQITIKQKKLTIENYLCETLKLPALPGLILAAYNGDYEAVDYFLGIHKDPDKNIEIMPLDVNLQDSFGNTALHYAVFRGKQRVVKSLINAKFPNKIKINIINKDGNTALHLGAIAGFSDACKELIIGGIDSLIVNNEGDTALELSQNQEVFDILRNCELIRDIRRQIGALHGFKLKEQKNKRKSRMKYNAKNFEPILDRRIERTNENYVKY